MLGRHCKAFVNTGTFASPTWVPISRFRDLTRPDSRAKAQNGDRGSDFDSTITGRRTVGVTGELRYVPGDDASDALKEAYDANTPVDMCFIDAPGTPGSHGQRGDFLISKWERAEPLDGAVMINADFDLTNVGGHGDLSSYTLPGA